MSIRAVQQRTRERRAMTMAAESGSAIPVTDSLHIQLLELEEDLKVLKSFGRIGDKIQHKRDVLLPKYRPYAQAHVEKNMVCQNLVFAYVVVWLFDVEDLDQALAWADIAIEQRQEMPVGTRGWPAFVADYILQWAERESESGHSIEPYFGQVFDRVANHWRLNEKHTAKFYKLAGLHLLRDENGKPIATCVHDVKQLEKARQLLETAHNLHAKAGVETMIRRINQRIKALNT